MESLHKELSNAETNVKLAEANLNLMKNEVENIRLKIQIKELENNLEKGFSTIFLYNSIKTFF